MDTIDRRFERLFTPLRVGGLELRNRIFVSAHGTGFAEGGLPNERHAHYYAARARGGAALVTTGATNVHPSSPGIRSLITSFDDRVIPGYRLIADAVHREGGRIFAQLTHLGRLATSDGTPVVGPSEVRDARFRQMPHELEPEEIAELVDAFAQAARRAREGGLDGVELQAAHGYLLGQFLSPLTNRRIDGYGGNSSSRVRFVLEIAEAIREQVGGDFPLGVRLSATELIEGGYDLDEGVRLTGLIAASGLVDYLNVTAGNDAETLSLAQHISPMYVSQGHLAPYAAAVKRAVSLPIFCIGRIVDPLLAEQILREGSADMIGMTRAHIADPELANKARQGRLADVRACIGCNQMCTGHREKAAKPISCVLNAEVGREGELGPLVPATRRKRVVVIGGGPAGLEAARVLALRGHHVSLHERGFELGGQVLIAVRAPGREEYGGARRYLEHAIRSAGVEIHVGSEMTAESVMALEPEAVVVATGARPLMAELPGADGLNVVSAWDVLRGAATPGQKVVVVDGEGHIQAASTADLLASRGQAVEVIAEFELVGVDLDTKTMTHVYRRLLLNGVRLTPHTRLRRVEGHDVIVADTFIGRERRIEGVDTLVLALGGSAENGLFHALKGHIPELYAVGDCVAPRRLNHAIHEGYAVGRRV